MATIQQLIIAYLIPILVGIFLGILICSVWWIIWFKFFRRKPDFNELDAIEKYYAEEKKFEKNKLKGGYDEETTKEFFDKRGIRGLYDRREIEQRRGIIDGGRSYEQAEPRRDVSLLPSPPVAKPQQPDRDFQPDFKRTWKRI